jgi:hypothetical protein
MNNNHRFSTRSYLEGSQTPSAKEQLEIYNAIQAAVSNITPWAMVTVTTSTPVTDEIVLEGLLRRFVGQLHRTVLGMRKKSKIPAIAIIERGGSGALHAHLIVGHIEGGQRRLSDTDFKHYMQKQLFPSCIKILQRLSYRQGTTTGKIGKCDIALIHSREGVVDYVLKSAKAGVQNIAWLATNISFQGSEEKECP